MDNSTSSASSLTRWVSYSRTLSSPLKSAPNETGLSGVIEDLEKRVNALGMDFDNVYHNVKKLEQRFTQHLNRTGKETLVVDVLEALRAHNRTYARSFLYHLQYFLCKTLENVARLTNTDQSDITALKKIMFSQHNQSSSRKVGEVSKCDIKTKVLEEFQLKDSWFYYITVIGDVIGWETREELVKNKNINLIKIAIAEDFKGIIIKTLSKDRILRDFILHILERGLREDSDNKDRGLREDSDNKDLTDAREPLPDGELAIKHSVNSDVEAQTTDTGLEEIEDIEFLSA